MKISVVTPVYNQERFLQQTLDSISSQTFHNYEHIIVDGLSSDRTPDIIEAYRASNPCIYVREKDDGMYDAINKGFSLASGDIYFYVNADDLVAPEAFSIVHRLFSHNPDLMWLKGVTDYIDTNGVCVQRGKHYHYCRSFIKKGYYGPVLHFIQQTSIFWRRELWELANGISAKLKYAGDFELWIKFARFAPLYTIPDTLAYFRRHDTQLSTQMDDYLSEIKSIVSISTIEKFFVNYFIRALHYVPFLFRNEIKKT